MALPYIHGKTLKDDLIILLLSWYLFLYYTLISSFRILKAFELPAEYKKYIRIKRVECMYEGFCFHTLKRCQHDYCKDFVE